MEQLQQQLQQLVSSSMDQLEKMKIRPIQKAGYECCARCFDDAEISQEGLQHCQKGCMRPLESINQIVNQEVNQFQNGLNSCVQYCQTNVQSMATGSSDNSALQREFEECGKKCFQDYIGRTGPLVSRIESSIDRFK